MNNTTASIAAPILRRPLVDIKATIDLLTITTIEGDDVLTADVRDILATAIDGE